MNRFILLSLVLILFITFLIISPKEIISQVSKIIGGTVAEPAASGDLLLSDGTSRLILTDGSFLGLN